MATSGTTNFNLTIDEIIEEAYNRCGMRVNSGMDMKRARRNLNLLFSEWGNRGVHLWKVANAEIALVNGTNEYTTPTDCNDVLEAYVSTGSGNGPNIQDVSLTKIDRSAYAGRPDKGTTGQPSEYYVDRQETPIIYLYHTPNAATYTHLKFYYMQKIEDVGSYFNTPDVVFRFLPCMVSGLAYYVSFEKKPELTQGLKMAYEDEMMRALDGDGSRTSLYVAPQTYFGDGV